MAPIPPPTATFSEGLQAALQSSTVRDVSFALGATHTSKHGISDLRGNTVRMAWEMNARGDGRSKKRKNREEEEEEGGEGRARRV